MPLTMTAQLAGSGTVSETPSRRANGGSPLGVPIAVNDSTSLPLVGVKVISSVIHPEKPWLGRLTTGV